MKYSRINSVVTPKKLRSFSFIPRTFFISKQIKHFSHSRTKAIAVLGFDFCGGEIGCYMADDSFFYKKILACQKDFCHNIAVVTKIFGSGFSAKIIKTIGFWGSDVVTEVAVGIFF